MPVALFANRIHVVSAYDEPSNSGSILNYCLHIPQRIVRLNALTVLFHSLLFQCLHWFLFEHMFASNELGFSPSA